MLGRFLLDGLFNRAFIHQGQGDFFYNNRMSGDGCAYPSLFYFEVVGKVDNGADDGGCVHNRAIDNRISRQGGHAEIIQCVNRS